MSTEYPISQISKYMFAIEKHLHDPSDIKLHLKPIYPADILSVNSSEGNVRIAYDLEKGMRGDIFRNWMLETAGCLNDVGLCDVHSRSVCEVVNECLHKIPQGYAIWKGRVHAKRTLKDAVVIELRVSDTTKHKVRYAYADVAAQVSCQQSEKLFELFSSLAEVIGDDAPDRAEELRKRMTKNTISMFIDKLTQ